MLRVLISLLCAAALAAGWGRSRGDGADSALEHLPQDARAVGAADFEKLRRSLSLPKDADLAEPVGGLSLGPGRLAVAAGTAIRYLSIPQDTPPAPGDRRPAGAGGGGQPALPGGNDRADDRPAVRRGGRGPSAEAFRERDGCWSPSGHG